VCKNGGARDGRVLRVTLLVDMHPSASCWDAAAAAVRPSVRTVLVLDKSLASIEAEDRWENACDCRVPAATLKTQDVRPYSTHVRCTAARRGGALTTDE